MHARPPQQRTPAPGQGSLDLPGFVHHLLATGYAGAMALEVFDDIYRRADPRHAATGPPAPRCGSARTRGTAGDQARSA